MVVAPHVLMMASRHGIRLGGMLVFTMYFRFYVVDSKDLHIINYFDTINELCCSYAYKNYLQRYLVYDNLEERYISWEEIYSKALPF